MKRRLVRNLLSGAVAATVLFQVIGRCGITTYAEDGSDQTIGDQQSISENGDDITGDQITDNEATGNETKDIVSTDEDQAGSEDQNDNNDQGSGDSQTDLDNLDDPEDSDDLDQDLLDPAKEDPDSLEAEAEAEGSDNTKTNKDASESKDDNEEYKVVTITYIAGEGGTLQGSAGAQESLTEEVVIALDTEDADGSVSEDSIDSDGIDGEEAAESSAGESEDAESDQEDTNSIDDAANATEDVADKSEESAPSEDSTLVEADDTVEGATALPDAGYEFVSWTLADSNSLVSEAETLELSVDDIETFSGDANELTFMASFKQADVYAPVEFTPTVYSSLSGKDLTADEFSYYMVSTDANGNSIDGYAATAKNKADGEVQFPSITYDKPGTYYYKITQTNDGKEGYSYDDNFYSLRVYVAEDSQKAGTLNANAAYFKNANAPAITVRMYDYKEDDKNGSPVNDDHAFKFSNGSKYNGFNRWVGSQKGIYQGIVVSTLGEDGYPVLNSAVTKSSESLAYLFNGTTDGVEAYNDNATLYNADGNGMYSFNSSSFYPFGSGDNLFGVVTETAFIIPEDGKAGDSDMIYRFSGDDDVWVYVDGKLVIDLGGIHDAYGAEVNFNTGAVSYFNPVDGGAAPANKYISNLSEVFLDGWKDGEMHQLKIFYFERGKYKSNYNSMFNLNLIANFSNTYEETIVPDVPKDDPTPEDPTDTPEDPPVVPETPENPPVVPETPENPPVAPETPQEPTTTTTTTQTSSVSTTPEETPAEISAPPVPMVDEQPEVLGETRLAVTDESEEEAVLGENRNRTTGDDFNIAVNIIIMIVAAMAIVVLAAHARKRRTID